MNASNRGRCFLMPIYSRRPPPTVRPHAVTISSRLKRLLSSHLSRSGSGWNGLAFESQHTHTHTLLGKKGKSCRNIKLANLLCRKCKSLMMANHAGHTTEKIHPLVSHDRKPGKQVSCEFIFSKRNINKNNQFRLEQNIWLTCPMNSNKAKCVLKHPTTHTHLFLYVFIYFCGAWL